MEQSKERWSPNKDNSWFFQFVDTVCVNCNNNFGCIIKQYQKNIRLDNEQCKWNKYDPYGFGTLSFSCDEFEESIIEKQMIPVYEINITDMTYYFREEDYDKMIEFIRGLLKTNPSLSIDYSMLPIESIDMCH